MSVSRRKFLALAAGLLGATGCSRFDAKKLMFWKNVEAQDLKFWKDWDVQASDLKFWNRNVGPLTFAAMNDLHMTDARSTSLLNRAVKQINADDRIGFTVVLGDVASEAKLTEMELAKLSLEKLKQPYFVVPGNHDVDTKAADPFGRFKTVFGDVRWREEDAGWVFLGINTCEGGESDVSVQPDEIDWIRRQLEKTNEKRPIAVFGHHPFNPNTKAYRVKNAEEVLGLFANHNLKLVAAGHFHGNQVEEHDGVLFTTSACLSTTRGNHDKTDAKGYRLFHLMPDSIETEFVEVTL